MARRAALTDSEIGLLETALRRDGIDAGYLRPLLWRRGWLAAPSSFKPINVDDLVNTLILTLLITAVCLRGIAWLLVAALLTAVVVVGLHFLARVPGSKEFIWRDVLAWLLLPVLLSLDVVFMPAIPAVSVGGWPGPDVVSDALRLGWVMFLIGAVSTILRHYRYWRRRKLSRWHDYVAAATVAEAF